MLPCSFSYKFAGVVEPGNAVVLMAWSFSHLLAFFASLPEPLLASYTTLLNIGLYPSDEMNA